MTGTVQLLLPASELAGRTVLILGRGMARERVVWAFTDTEALAAWGRHPEGTATAVDRRTLAAMLDDGPAMLVVNAAGPEGRLIAGPALTGDDRHEPGWDQLPDPGQLPGPDERRSRRDTAIDAAIRTRMALERGDHPAALEASREGIAASNELGDLLHAATATGDLSAALAASGQTGAAGAAAEAAGMLLGALGETDLGVEMLIRAAELALAAGDPATAGRLSRTAAVGAAGPAGPRLAALWRSLPAADADLPHRAPAGYDR